MQTANEVENLKYLHDAISNLTTVSDQLQVTINITEQLADLTHRLTGVTHDLDGQTHQIKADSNDLRDHIADFDDFWRPLRSYFYWEKHCFDIPMCWSLRPLFDSLDGFDQLAEQFHKLTKDLGDTARATHELLAIIPQNIAVSKAIRDTTLTIYSSFDSLIDQFDRLTDTNAV